MANNNLIITKRFNPIFCIKGFEPTNSFLLGIKLEAEYSFLTANILIVEYKLDQYLTVNSLINDSKEYLHLLNEANLFELKRLQLKNYLTYLSVHKNINLR